MIDPTGGPAFPAQEFCTGFDEDPPVMAKRFHQGATIRDMYAMHILTGMLAHGWAVTDAIDIAFDAADVAILRRQKIPRPS